MGNYESVLAAAIKDELHIDGVINPYLANAATRIIHNPEFQSVKDRLEDDLTQQTRDHIEQTNFEHRVAELSVDARINGSDLDYIISNLQQPPPPPAPPPPPKDAAADRARLIAELDGLAQERERQSRQEMIAQRNATDLAAQDVATPAQQIVRENHHHNHPLRHATVILWMLRCIRTLRKHHKIMLSLYLLLLQFTQIPQQQCPESRLLSQNARRWSHASEHQLR